jgi:Tol biopolymer transport system component
VEGGLTWSLDGRRLAVSLLDPSFLALSSVVSKIYSIDINDGTTTRPEAAASEYGAASSPDGSAIAFVSDRDAQSGIFGAHPDDALA